MKIPAFWIVNPSNLAH